VGLIERWVVGEGGFIGEASLIELSVDEHRRYSRRGRFICELTDVYVHPLRRGRGWARVVVEAALDYADAEGWDVFLRVVTYGKDSQRGPHRLDVESLIAFYGRLGFVGRRDDPRCMVRRWRAC
jgi:GNAT superfamily N-acetyltransferase